MLWNNVLKKSTHTIILRGCFDNSNMQKRDLDEDE